MKICSNVFVGCISHHLLGDTYDPATLLLASLQQDMWVGDLDCLSHFQHNPLILIIILQSKAV